MKTCLFISEGYPNEYTQRYTFLDNLVCAMADAGVQCTVCNPASITHSLIHKEPMPPRKWIRTTPRGNTITVFSPRILTFSSSSYKVIKRIIAFINLRNFRRAVWKVIKKNKLTFQVAYGHFITPSALVAVDIAQRTGCQSCLAYGENTSYTIDELGLKYIQRQIHDIDCVVAVSTENKEYLLSNSIVPPETIRVFPNGINRQVFRLRDKQSIREKYGFPQEAFIIAFVGYFTQIKGSQRLSAAVDRLDGVYSIFIGSGSFQPTCNNILYKGSMKHEKIGQILSAADIFVLPTIAEGCCNAIIQAMGCGLPVVSSNLSFNDDILDDNCSIRIDTLDIDSIAEAISYLKNNTDIRTQMSKAALSKADSLDINERAKKIIAWIDECRSKKEYI